jgi:uncharacterized protein YkwD
MEARKPMGTARIQRHPTQNGVYAYMRIFRHALAASLVLSAAADLARAQDTQSSGQGFSQNLRGADEQLLAQANQSRATAGAGPLVWDPALAAAALAHCRRMAAEGEISHRYGGEPELTDRAGAAGSHFSLIEENVALGTYVDMIHDGWMHSPGHRANLLNPQVNRVGIAVVAAHGVYYAVADYARAVILMSRNQVEAAVGAALQGKGLMVLQDATDARAYCSSGARPASAPGFLMLWQDADVMRLPQPLSERMVTGRYRKAEVGSCPAQNVEGAFTVYRVAVLLY